MDSPPSVAYRQTSASSATPVGVIIALFDTILRDFRRALVAIDAGKVEARVLELNHALTVIAHLRSVLNHERGKDAARVFERFYNVTHAMLLMANLQGNKATLEKLGELYGSLRMAWYEAEEKLRRELQPPSTEAGDVVTTGTSRPETARERWSA